MNGERGASLPPYAPCPSCGTGNPAGSKFCQSCGMQLQGGAPAPPQAAFVQPPRQVVYAQPAPVVPVVHVGPVNNGLCIASMVLGIIAAVFLWVPYFGIVLGVLAVIFGAVGISIANKRGQAGQGMGIAGLVLGIIALAVNIVFIIWVWHWWGTVSNYYY